MTRSSFRAANTGVALVAAALLLPACIVRAGKPYPLYPNPEQARAPQEIARLVGPIGFVDGQDVSRLGKSFALLPGCHHVQLAKKVAEVSTNSPTAYVATLPPEVTYALHMQASHTYEFEVSLQGNTGPTTTDAVVAIWDRDQQGHATRIPEPPPNAPPACANATP